MNRGRRWTDFTYLFTTRKINHDLPFTPITEPDPRKVERRRKIEERNEQRELGQRLAEVWE